MEAVKPGLRSRTISRHTISPGRKNGQHTATTSRAPHSPRPQRADLRRADLRRADLRRADLWRAGLGAGTVAAHVHKGGIGQQDNADDLA
ncbi:pentapeptide repeat-containing protein [Corynebacterium simulans]|uniref:pentapeptide repeat-containing protein n=1 Tax=Corynebacterium simulans TaxID=146827 RepID=UPI003D79BED7